MTVYHLPVRGSSFGTTADSQSSFRGVLKSLPGVFFVALLFMVLPAQRAAAAVGGPDAAGYRFVDSAEVGLSYSFENISGTGTVAATASSIDDSLETVAMGFGFNYYGTSYVNCNICSNGFLSFNDSSNQFTDVPIPNAAVPNNMIAGWWDDLHPGQAGDIYYQTLGSAPNRRFIVQFQAVQERSVPANANLNTFQFKLFEGTNAIEIHYQSVAGGADTSTIGIENADGSDGLQLFSAAATSFPTPTSYAVRFYQPLTVTNNLNSGAGSLRQAIVDAVPGQVIVFAPSLSGNTITLGGTELSIGKTLTIDASSLANGIRVSGGDTSRIFNIPAAGNLTIRNLRLWNGSSGFGGAVNLSGTLTADSCEFRFNHSPNSAAAINVGASGSATIKNSLIANNTADGDVAGALLTSGGSVTIDHTTIANNTASRGTAFFIQGGATVAITNSTITGNFPNDGSGGAMANAGGTITAENTIIAGNVSGESGGVTFSGANLTSGDPQLLALADYGGPTPTMPPMPGSPAIDAAGSTDPGGIDQRGAPRFVNGALDIGAVEFLPTIVTTATDEDNVVPGSGLSLREAIAAPFVSTITFDGAMSGNTTTLVNGQLLIDKSLTIDASSLAEAFVVNANGAVTEHRGIEVTSDQVVGINGLTITGGNLVPSQENGGGILTAGTLTLEDTTVSDSAAWQGGGIFTSGDLTINNSTIAGNLGQFQTGGLAQTGGISTLTGCTLTGNTTPNNGGAAYISASGICTLVNCTVEGNASTSNGSGGGIMTYASAQLYVINSTIANNSAGFGGGIRQGQANVTVTLENSIVAGNRGSGPDVSGAVASHAGINFLGTTSGATGLGTFGTDYLTGDAMLSALGYYGGATETMHPRIGSPVIDPVGGATSSGQTTDQRGFPRVVDGGRTTAGAIVDIGAVEAGPVLEVTSNANTGTGSLRDRLAIAAAAPGAANHLVFDSADFPDAITVSSAFAISGHTVFLDASDVGGSGVQFSGGNSSRLFEISNDATAAMHSVTIRDGNPSSSGGGIFNQASLTLISSTVSNNVSSNIGGGIWNWGALAVLDHCTVSGNTSSNGAGIMTDGGAMRLSHCTVSGNVATTTAGGIRIFSSTLMLEDSIVAGNEGVSSLDISKEGSSIFSLKGTNLIGSLSGSGLTAGPAVLTGAPGLALLGAYGGPTSTMPPLFGSPVIDAAPASFSATDQRGVLRPVGSANDLGSVEAVVLTGLAPVAGGPLTSIAPSLTWSGPTEVSQFEIFFGTDPNNLLSQGFQSSPFNLAGLIPGSTYYWRVDSIVGGGVARSAVQTFDTRPNLVVTTEDDENDGFTVGEVSLREAIADAVDGETIVIAPSLDGRRCVLTNGQLVLDDDILIDASALSRGFIIDANGAVTNHRVVQVLAGNAVVLDSLTITGGSEGSGSGLGGGVWNGGDFTLRNGTVSGNQCAQHGGGIYNNTGALLNLVNCTVAKNSTGSLAGGVYVIAGSSATFNHTTIFGNRTINGGGGLRSLGTVQLLNSIVAGNTSTSNEADIRNGGSLTGSGVNLIGDNSSVTTQFPAGPTAGTSASPLDPMLSPLGYYGGPGETMHPLIGSPAIDPAGGATSSGLTTDQRGFARVVDGGRTTAGAIVDIGAVEAGPVLEVTSNGDTGAGSLRIQLSAAAMTPAAANHIVFDGPHTINLGSQLFVSGHTVLIDASDIGAPGVHLSGGTTTRAFAVQPSGRLALHSLTLRDGSHGNCGGAIYNLGALTLIRATLIGNTALSWGGAICNDGGGLPGLIVMDHCTVSGNETTAGRAGGIMNFGEMRLTYCTVADNQASTDSGGIRVHGAGFTLVLENSIVSGNSSTTSPDLGNGGGLVIQKGVNLIGDLTGSGLTGSATLLEGGASLAPLADYGGPTESHALLPGSAAIDAAAEFAGAPGSDQRGSARVVDGDGNGTANPDLGAFEVGETIVDTIADSGAGSLREALNAPSSGNVIRFNPTVFDGSPGSTIVLDSQLFISGKVLSVDASGLLGGVTISGNGVARVFLITGQSTVLLDSVTITNGNAGSSSGGGIFNSSSTLTVRNSTLTGNSARWGGGLYSSSNTTTLIQCTLTSNIATLSGGAIFNNFGKTVLTRCTITGNTAPAGEGSGVASYGASDTETEVSGSIISGNSSGDVDLVVDSSHNSFTSTGFNLLGTGDALADFNQAGDQTGVTDPLLAPLGNYGGLTQTMPPLVGSPAIDAGGATSLTTDQRGYSRVIAGILADGGGSAVADIGAVEAGVVRLVKNSSGGNGTDSLRDRLNAFVNPGERILFNLEPTDNVITLTTEFSVSGTRNQFIDASALVDASGVIVEKDDGFGNFFVPRGVTLEQTGPTRICYIAPTATAAFSGVRLTGGNVVNNLGGGILNNGTLELIKSTIDGNQSSGTSFGDGGGVYSNGVLGIHQCTFSENTALSDGGAIGSSGELRIDQSTISANEASTNGGGIYLTGSGTLTILNSLVADNTSGGSGPDLNRTGSASIEIEGPNLIGDNDSMSAEFPADGLLVGGGVFGPLDPVIAALGNNGGATPTMMLLPGSPAIDAGEISGATPQGDQRDLERVLIGGLDLGAYEASAGDYNLAGLTVYSTVDPALTGSGVKIEISGDPGFRPIVNTVAGIGSTGAQNGPRATASFNYPSGVAKDGFGNFFVADTANNRIRMIAPDGEVSTIAGTGVYGLVDGPGATARFAVPAGIAVGPNNDLYVSDTFNHCIRKLTRPAVAGQPWTVATLAGNGSAGSANGAGTVARFSHPHGLVVDDNGNVYVADSINHLIRKVTPTGEVRTLAGTGSAGFAPGVAGNISPFVRTAEFNFPAGLALDDNDTPADGTDDILYVADRDNHRIRAINFNTDQVTTVAGTGGAGKTDGAALSSTFRSPVGLALDHVGNLYIADQENHAIRKLNTGGAVSTVAGLGLGNSGSSNGNSTVATFNCPAGLVVDLQGDPLDPTVNLVVADTHNHLIRRIAVDPIRIKAVVSGGRDVTATLNATALGLNPGETYYFRWMSQSGVMETQSLGQSFVLVDPPTVVTVAAADLSSTSARFNATLNPKDSPTGVYFEYSTDPDLAAPLRVGTLMSDASAAMRGVVEDGAGNLYVANAAKGAHTILKFDLSGALLATYGEGPAGAIGGAQGVARFDHPAGLAYDDNDTPGVLSDDTLYVADEFNHRIRIINLGTGVVSDFAGSGEAGFQNGPGLGPVASSARFLYPCGVVLDSAGNLYVADSGNHRIRKVTSAGEVSTLAGSGVAGFAEGAPGSARFSGPRGVAVDGNDKLFIADTGNNRVRTITPGSNVVTVAGSGVKGFLDGAGVGAKFAAPTGLAIATDGVIFVTDRDNHLVRRIATNGEVGTVVGSGLAGLRDSPVGELHPASTTRFHQPLGIALDGSGNLFVTQGGRHSLQLVSAASTDDLPTEGESLVVIALVGSELHVRIFDDKGTEVIDKTEADLTAGQKLTDLKTWLGTVPFPDEATLSGEDQQEKVLCAREIAGYDHSALRKISRDALPTVEIVGKLGGNTDQNVAATPSEFLFLPGGTYYFRAVASNGRNHEVRGEILSFTTPQSEIVVHKGANNSAPFLTPGEVIDFGSAPFNLAVDRVYTIENTGGSPLQITSVTLSGPESGGFALSSGSWTGTVAATELGNTVIAEGASLSFTATLESASAGAFAGEIVISSNDQDEDAIAFEIIGEVLAPPAITNLAHRDVTATDVTFRAEVDPLGSSTEVEFEFSKFEDFEGVLEVLTKSGSDQGFANGCGPGANFNSPSDVAADQFGNIFVADTLNHCIRKITVTGDCTVLAGSRVAGYADGFGAAAQFNAPEGLAVDQFGNVYVADTLNHRIRRISPAGEVITVAGFGGASFTDGIASAARFDHPTGVDVDQAGTLFVADSRNGRVRKIAGGQVTTVNSSFEIVRDVAVGADGSLFVAEFRETMNLSAITRINSNGTIVAYLGGVTFVDLTGIAVDSSGQVYVTDGSDHIIVVTPGDPGSGAPSLVAGVFGSPGTDDGLAGVAKFSSPAGVAISPSGTIFIADKGNHRIRQIDLSARTVVAASGLTGTGPQEVEVTVGGLDPNTTYYYRAIARNGGGSSFSPGAAPYPSFLTLDNVAELTLLTVDGTPVPGFDPCVYSYAQPSAAMAMASIMPTAASDNASIRLYQDGAFLREVESGHATVVSDLTAGDNRFAIEVISEDGTASRTYNLNIVREEDSPTFASWQELNFGSDSNDPLIAGPLADPGDDGVLNLLKYAFGLDPNLTSRAGLPQTAQNGGDLTLTYPKNLDASDLTFEVEWSTNLTDWSSVGVTETILSDDTVTQTIEASISSGVDTTKYLRLRVDLIQP